MRVILAGIVALLVVLVPGARAVAADQDTVWFTRQGHLLTLVPATGEVRDRGDLLEKAGVTAVAGEVPCLQMSPVRAFLASAGSTGVDRVLLIPRRHEDLLHTVMLPGPSPDRVVLLKNWLVVFPTRTGPSWTLIDLQSGKIEPVYALARVFEMDATLRRKAAASAGSGAGGFRIGTVAWAGDRLLVEVSYQRDGGTGRVPLSVLTRLVAVFPEEFRAEVQARFDAPASDVWRVGDQLLYPGPWFLRAYHISTKKLDAYAWGVPAPAPQQIRYFLLHATPDTLLVLMLRPNPDGGEVAGLYQYHIGGSTRHLADWKQPFADWAGFENGRVLILDAGRGQQTSPSIYEHALAGHVIRAHTLPAEDLGVLAASAQALFLASAGSVPADETGSTRIYRYDLGTGDLRVLPTTRR